MLSVFFVFAIFSMFSHLGWQDGTIFWSSASKFFFFRFVFFKLAFLLKLKKTFPDVGYSLVDRLRGYSLDRENNCIIEQVKLYSKIACNRGGGELRRTSKTIKTT